METSNPMLVCIPCLKLSMATLGMVGEMTRMVNDEA